MQPESMNIVLTGACGGIGQLLARELAALGASLFLCGRDEAALADLQRELRAQARDGQVIEAKAVDLTDGRDRERWLDPIAMAGKPVNVLVNNAGICRFGMFESLAECDIDATMQLNSIVPMILAHRLLPVMKRQPEARIVNFDSTFGAIGFPGYSVY